MLTHAPLTENANISSSDSIILQMNIVNSNQPKKEAHTKVHL